MIGLPEICAGVMLIALVAYALLGGADFGAGVWDLLARGERAQRQRDVIADAIAPIWEANHVWLIVLVVMLFTAFPPAFAVLMTALHIPVTLMLIGIVLRGTSFVFRKYDSRRDAVQQRWGRLFAMSSVFSPILLGVIAGAISTGGIRVEDGVVTSGFVAPWLGPFPLAVGVFALTQFAFLAAVYLTLETRDPDLREDFRTRALASAAAVGVVAFAVLLLARSHSPIVWEDLTAGPAAVTLHLVTGAAAVGAILALIVRRWRTAAALAALQIALILVGWGLALGPWLVPGELTIRDAAAPDSVLLLLLVVLGGGSLILLPAFAYLYLVFKRRNIFPG
ncbi:MAG TPA: cytochrome d ubiquinol oxidase subunit II [Longimicrobiales bacterium]|nr:cytochrome d ubiquinol oxidase subunit II [Longimicrobiales bacterium]